MSLKQHAKSILELIDRGVYLANGQEVSIKTQVQAAIDGSRVYTPEQLETLRSRPRTGTISAIEVIEGTTQVVAQMMAKSGPLVLLNFASARNPGGGQKTKGTFWFY